MGFPAKAQFPAAQWDGSSASRSTALDGQPPLLDYRGPDPNDYSQVVAELQSMQIQLGAGGISATTATVGYLFIPSVAGIPTGVPANVPAGFNALAYDKTTHKLWVYDTAWKGVVVA